MSAEEQNARPEPDPFEPFTRQSTNRLPRFPFARPDLSIFERIASGEDVQDALVALEFVPSFDAADFYEPAPDEILEKILNGSNEIDISLNDFFGHFVETVSGYRIAAVPYGNKLWKRELFFGGASHFHPAVVATAIRKQPDILVDMANWFETMSPAHAGIEQDEPHGDVAESAERLIEDTLKFASFRKSQIPTMTFVTEKQIYQIVKPDVSEFRQEQTSAKTIGKRRVWWEPHRPPPSEYPEKFLFATLLIQGNRVVAIGSGSDVDQPFLRENLENLCFGEVTKEVSPAQTIVETEVNADKTFDFAFDIPLDTTPSFSNTVPLSGELFDLISEAVRITCADRRSIITASVMITEDGVTLHVSSPTELLKLHPEFLNTPTLAEFSNEICVLERKAHEAVEARIFDICYDHLGLTKGDLSLAVNSKMLELLIDAVRADIGMSDKPDYSDAWHRIAAKKRPDFFMAAVANRFDPTFVTNPPRRFR